MQVKTLCWFEYFGETLLCFYSSFFDLWNSNLGKYLWNYSQKYIDSTIITFSKLNSYSSPLFKSLGLVKFFDIALFQIVIFMYKFHNNVLPAAFHPFFTKVTSVHNYNTRFAAKHSHYLPSLCWNQLWKI